MQAVEVHAEMQESGHYILAIVPNHHQFGVIMGGTTRRSLEAHASLKGSIN